MSIRPTEDGGRVVYGKTPWGDYIVEFDAHGKVVCADCVVKEPGHPASRGLGDTIEKITSKLRIKSCGGCKKRRDWLNKKLPYRSEEST